MMKFLYIALIPIFVILITIYTALQLFYKPPILDKNMIVFTDSLVRNTPVLNIRELKDGNETFKHPMPSDIWKYNLFDPGRGGMLSISSSGSGGGIDTKNVELVGIFNDGEIKGAIILMKTTSGTYGSYDRVGQPSYPSKLQEKQQVPVKQKTVFKIGERLPNGLVLESVGPDFIVLRGGSGKVKLEMTFPDENSEKRIAESAKAASTMKQDITIISGTQQGGTGSFGGQQGSKGATVIIPSGSGGSSSQSQGVFQGYGK